MILELDEFLFDQNDHCWLESTKVTDYYTNHDCDNCQSKMLDFLFVVNKSGEKGLTTGLCEKCGYIKRTKNLTEDTLQEHFSKRWLTRIPRTYSPEDTLYKFIKPYMKNPNKGKVLDIGCGDGDQLASFRDNGFEIYGVEPSKLRSETARKKLNTTNIETGFSEDYLRKSTETFDVIYFHNVLQFTDNPYVQLDLAVKRLNPNGLIYIRAQRYDYSDFAFLSTIAVIRSFLSLYAMKGFFEKNKMDILFHTDRPYVMVLQKNGTQSEATKKILASAKLIDRQEIVNTASKDFLTLKSRITKKISLKKKELKRILKLKIQDSSATFPIEIRTGNNLPVILK